MNFMELTPREIALSRALGTHESQNAIFLHRLYGVSAPRRFTTTRKRVVIVFISATLNVIAGTSAASLLPTNLLDPP